MLVNWVLAVTNGYLAEVVAVSCFMAVVDPLWMRPGRQACQVVEMGPGTTPISDLVKICVFSPRGPLKSLMP